MKRQLVPRERTMLRMLAQIAQDHACPGGAGNDDPVTAMPWARISLDEGLALWRHLPPFIDGLPAGVYLARRTPLSSVHFLGVAVYSAPHLYAALQVFCRYFSALVDMDQLRCHSTERCVSVIWAGMDESVPIALRDYAFTHVADLAARAGNRRVLPVRVELPDAPSNRADYVHLCRCPVYCSRGAARISFNAASLAVPLYTTNPALHELALQRLAGFDRGCTRIRDQVVAILLELFEQGGPRLQSVADRLGITPRTLQSRLAMEGTSFGDVLEEVRQQKAMRLLAQTDMPVTRVASELGYRSRGSFARAFREWCATSPRGFRQRMRETREPVQARNGARIRSGRGRCCLSCPDGPARIHTMRNRPSGSVASEDAGRIDDSTQSDSP